MFKACVFFWAFLLLGFTFHYTRLVVYQQLNAKNYITKVEESNTRSYLLTGDVNCLLNKQFRAIPYDNPERLIMLLSSPTIRSILPFNINPQNNQSFVKLGRFDLPVLNLIGHAYLFIVAGGLLLFGSITSMAWISWIHRK